MTMTMSGTGNINMIVLASSCLGQDTVNAGSEAARKDSKMARSRVMTTHDGRYIMGGVRQRCPLHAGPSPVSPVERVFREGYLMADRAKTTLTPA